MSELWNEYLYRPLFNGLIWIYSNWTNQNLGWAVVYITVLLRTALLPFTLVTEYKSATNTDDIKEELKRIDKDFDKDFVLKKEEIRRVLKKRRISPWAKAVVLGIQGLVLVLLYQVFVSGTTGLRMVQTLYPSVDFPGKINTLFFGFDLAAPHDVIWSGAVMIFLMAEIYVGFHAQKRTLDRSDMAYFVLFPVAVFFALWLLPMVKAVFILTSILYSVIVHQFSGLIFQPKKKKVAS